MKYSDLEEILSKTHPNSWVHLNNQDGLTHKIYKDDLEIRIVLVGLQPYQMYATSPLLNALSSFQGHREPQMATLYYKGQPIHAVQLIGFVSAQKPGEMLVLPNDAMQSDLNPEKLESHLFSKHIARIFNSHSAFPTVLANNFVHTDGFTIPSQQAQSPTPGSKPRAKG